MKKTIQTIVLIISIVACTSRSTTAGEGDEKIILIKTEYGNMKVKLYNETPLHRDNFIKLVEEKFYDDLLFHRVIKGFMIQGGDPNSKGASAKKRLGGGGPGYEIPAEIKAGLYHKKGALSAARTGDNANPERKSSGSQFYVVQGKVYDNNALDQFEQKQKFQAVRAEAMKIFRQKKALIQQLQKEGLRDSINAIQIQIQEEAEKKVDQSQFKINEERRLIYTSIGGTPHLDGAYTVFGEVIEGLNVIDSIANVQTAPGDRPLEDVIMSMEIID
ncbi:MAG: peptidylprolyl isomerase [Prolixibacteraceae bacterium]|jgi:cyclophilin family peptidyl-prolyl cis-trans isomerase|nr:peptidylprolyl isomerase [Prolixibacteraceae bacterium]